MINDFKELIPDIVNAFCVSDYFYVVMPYDTAPHQGTKYDIDGNVYQVTCVQDETSDEERENGWCYYRVTFEVMND